MIGTVRTFDESIRDTIEEELTRRSQGIAAAYGIKAETVYERRVSAVNNDPELTKMQRKRQIVVSVLKMSLNLPSLT